MSEPSKTLIFLRQQISTSDEVVGALKRSRSRPTLNEKGRDEIRKVLLRLRDTEMKIAESNESSTVCPKGSLKRRDLKAVLVDRAGCPAALRLTLDF